MLTRLFRSPKILTTTAAQLRTARAVKRQYGKPILEQFREIIQLRRGPGRLKRFDYYAYQLFDDSRYSMQEKREFVSWEWVELRKALNLLEWTAICDDKLITYALLRSLDLPHPEVYCVFQEGTRTYGSTPVLRDAGQMAAFLRSRMRYPFFGKPAQSWEGEGASSVDGIHRDRDVLLLADGGEVSVDEYVRTVPIAHSRGRKRKARTAAGYLFQERIRQHQEIDRLTGGRISTLRIIVLLWPDGAKVHRAIWKIPVGDSIVDNNRRGEAGNLRAYVDLMSGHAVHVIQGSGPQVTQQHWGLNGYGSVVERHPDTGERLHGYQLPYWDEIVRLCTNAASALPGVHYQSWDVAISPSGPLLIEVNHHGGTRVAQVPGAKGLNDDEFRRFWSLHRNGKRKR